MINNRITTYAREQAGGRLWYWEVKIDGKIFHWGRAKGWRKASVCINKYVKEAKKIIKGIKMIIISFGKWSTAAGRWFIRERIYINGYKWTPFCKIRRRYRRCNTIWWCD